MVARWPIRVLSLLALAGAAPAQMPAIRPVKELTMVGVTHEERGDVEGIYTVIGVTPVQYDFVVSSTIPNSSDPSNPQQLMTHRIVHFADDSTGHRLNILFASDDPSFFPGSTIFFSKAMLAELKNVGKTAAIVGDAPPDAFQGLLASFGAVRHYYRGQLTRVGPTTVSVIVNGVPTSLPAIESRGHLSVGADGDDVDVVTFDNPSWPLTLKWASQGRSWQLTEIEQPPGGGTEKKSGFRGHMGADLTKGCRAEIHGIYFAFGSATLVSESDRALRDIETLLADNPGWVVTIEGHTDSIGTHVSNLDLSRRRAAAVRDALVTRFNLAASRLSATGYGDTRPVGPNTTIEGRARNRRVELARKC